jgi:hypothetical protein
MVNAKFIPYKNIIIKTGKKNKGKITLPPAGSGPESTISTPGPAAEPAFGLSSRRGCGKNRRTG